MKKLVVCIICILFAFFLGFGVTTHLNKSCIFELKDMKEEDISFEEKKINLYLFYGKGCPHCEDMIDFLNTLPYSLKRKIHLYTFEVWYNEDSYNLFMDMGETLDIEMQNIPFLFVGDAYFEGFKESNKKELKQAIENLSKEKNRKDLYRDYLDLKAE